MEQKKKKEFALFYFYFLFFCFLLVGYSIDFIEMAQCFL